MWIFIAPVCFGIVEKFSETISEEIKQDHKLIEEQFKEFCKNVPSREKRFVSSANQVQ